MSKNSSLRKSSTSHKVVNPEGDNLKQLYLVVCHHLLLIIIIGLGICIIEYLSIESSVVDGYH